MRLHFELHICLGQPSCIPQLLRQEVKGYCLQWTWLRGKMEKVIHQTFGRAESRAPVLRISFPLPPTPTTPLSLSSTLGRLCTCTQGPTSTYSVVTHKEDNHFLTYEQCTVYSLLHIFPLKCHFGTVSPSLERTKNTTR